MEWFAVVADMTPIMGGNKVLALVIFPQGAWLQFEARCGDFGVGVLRQITALEAQQAQQA